MMTNMLLVEFGEFFQQATGFSPFLWQSRMANEVAERGRWPDQIALPTSVGKSSIVTIWAYALARDLLRATFPRCTPMRLIYVVDRRIIVDAVDQQAQAIATLLESSESLALRSTAEALRPYADAPALQVTRARGGVPHKRLWVHAPNQPTILTSTVDQSGSQLLFRGYGISQGQRPIHAGLLGVDSLFVVDEAHLSTPFVQTLLKIQAEQQGREALAKLPPLSVVAMSATLPDGGDGWIFTLNASETEELAPRLRQPKWMTMQLTPAVTGKTTTDSENAGKPSTVAINETTGNEVSAVEKPSEALDDFFVARPALQSAIMAEVNRIANDIESGIGAVVVNHVKTARAVFTAMKKKAKYDKAKPGECRDVVLLTGRVRGYDRDVLLRRWLPQMQAQRIGDSGEMGVVWVVATQTIEVGADFDFDALITECATLPALRQRLGRLNRLGQRTSGVGTIVRPEHAKGIYSDEALRATWEWLIHSVDRPTPESITDDGITPPTISPLPSPFIIVPTAVNGAVIIDGSTAALDTVIAQNPPILTEDPPLNAPILLLPHIEAWAQTKPAPTLEPDIAPFLHGKRKQVPDVHVVWRQDLTQDLLLRASQDAELEGQIADFLVWLPPTPAESLDVPIWAVREWLEGAVVQPLLADFDSAGMDAVDPKDPKQMDRRMAWRWEKSGVKHVVAPNDIHPGDTVLVPAGYGGADEWGLNLWPESKKPPSPVADVADVAQAAHGRRHLRLALDLIQAVITPDILDYIPWRDALAALTVLADPDTPRVDFRTALDQWLQLVTPLVTLEMQSIIQECRDHLPSITWQVYPDSLGPGIVIFWYAQAQGETLDDDADDATNCLGDQQGITLPTLQAHQDAVAAWIALYTRRGLIPTRMAEVVRLAGKYHDLGKLDPRFQLMMHGGDAVAAMADIEPVAKSNMDPRDRAAFVQAQFSAKYPHGQRHEELSVRLAQSMDFSEVDKDNLPLLWHLIGTHHGWGRPWFPANEDANPVSIATMYQGQHVYGESTPILGQLDSGWIDQFEKLQTQYGFWGLAYLESIVRLADYQASATKGGPQ